MENKVETIKQEFNVEKKCVTGLFPDIFRLTKLGEWVINMINDIDLLIQKSKFENEILVDSPPAKVRLEPALTKSNMFRLQVPHPEAKSGRNGNDGVAEYVGEVRDVESGLEVLLEPGRPPRIAEVDRGARGGAGPRVLRRMRAKQLLASPLQDQSRADESLDGGGRVGRRDNELRGGRRRERVHWKDFARLCDREVSSFDLSDFGRKEKKLEGESHSLSPLFDQKVGDILSLR
ncbi:hypothetical protein RHMOL_Rhmol10G0252800 [Rhododendron molle]|uniref:Uncharacterized protein n=1 Tax=Rhododendron molle TaxID=49168 RepID=A0ACC0M7U3_RHOML|nr:hypothetical protein RHMOL_Rhmol10G0252800 [Rhododendron molle]